MKIIYEKHGESNCEKKQQQKNEEKKPIKFALTVNDQWIVNRISEIIEEEINALCYEIIS